MILSVCVRLFIVLKWDFRSSFCCLSWIFRVLFCFC